MSKLFVNSPFLVCPIPSAFPEERHKWNKSMEGFLVKDKIVGAKNMDSSSGWAVTSRIFLDLNVTCVGWKRDAKIIEMSKMQRDPDDNMSQLNKQTRTDFFSQNHHRHGFLWCRNQKLTHRTRWFWGWTILWAIQRLKPFIFFFYIRKLGKTTKSDHRQCVNLLKYQLMYQFSVS